MSKTETSRTKAVRRSKGKSTRPKHRVSPVQATENFQEYCRGLAEATGTHRARRILRALPVAMTLVGILLAFGLIYVRLTWWAFGVMFAVAGVAGMVAGGATAGDTVLRERLLKWFRKWPLWESILAGFAVAFFVVGAFVYGYWIPAFLGTVVGLAVVAVALLGLSPSIQAIDERNVPRCRALVERVEERGVNPLLIQEGLPKLMGVHWPTIFEKVYGYDAYRSVSRQLELSQPQLLVKRRKIRDFVCDAVTRATYQRHGVIMTMIGLRREMLQQRQAKKWLATFEGDEQTEQAPADAIEVVKNASPLGGDDAELLSSDSTTDNNQLTTQQPKTFQELPATVYDPEISSPGESKHAHMHAGTIQIGSLKTDNVIFRLSPEDLAAIAAATAGTGAIDDAGTSSESPINDKKAAYDRMLQDAWSDSTKRRKRYPKLQKWLGEEARITVGFVLLGVFGIYLLQAGVFQAILGDAFANFQPTTWEGWRMLSRALIEIVGDCPSRLWPLGVSGWAIGAAGLLWMASGLIRDGWPLTPFVAVATLAIGVTWTIAIGFDSEDATWVWVGLVIAFCVMVSGFLLDRRIPDWIDTTDTRIQS